MAKTGRPRKPTAMHKAKGSYRPDRHNDDEPTPIKGKSTAPMWVLGDAQQHWDVILPMLEGMGVMAPAFSPGLALLVNSLGRYIEFENKVTETGVVSVTDKGNEIVNPVWAARNKAWDQVMKALREYGLTPSSITGVRACGVDGGKQHDGNADDAKSAALRLVSG